MDIKIRKMTDNRNCEQQLCTVLYAAGYPVDTEVAGWALRVTDIFNYDTGIRNGKIYIKTPAPLPGMKKALWTECTPEKYIRKVAALSRTSVRRLPGIIEIKNLDSLLRKACRKERSITR